jgi:uncharacterized protein (UPF0371 family)
VQQEQTSKEVNVTQEEIQEKTVAEVAQEVIDNMNLLLNEGCSIRDDLQALTRMLPMFTPEIRTQMVDGLKERYTTLAASLPEMGSKFDTIKTAPVEVPDVA